MTNMLEVVKGSMWLGIAYALTAVTWFTVPAMLDALELAFPPATNAWSSGLFGIVWFGLFAAWVTGLLFLPAWKIVDAIQMSTPRESNIAGLGQGALFFVFGIAISIAGWYWVPALAGIFDDTFMSGLVYVSIMTWWFLTFLVAPVNKIIKAKQG